MDRCMEVDEILTQLSNLGDYDTQPKLKILRNGIKCHPENSLIWAKLISTLIDAKMIREVLEGLRKMEESVLDRDAETNERMARVYSRVAQWLDFTSSNKKDPLTIANLYEKSDQLAPYLPAGIAAAKWYGYERGKSYQKAAEYWKELDNRYKEKKLGEIKFNLAMNLYYMRDYKGVLEALINYPWLKNRSHKQAIEVYIKSYIEGVRTAKLTDLTIEEDAMYRQLSHDWLTTWQNDTDVITMINSFASKSVNTSKNVVNHRETELEKLQKRNIELEAKIASCSCNRLKETPKLEGMEQLPVDYGI